MSRSKAILMLLVAMILGLFAMMAAATQMNQSGAGKRTASIIVAAKDIPFGKILKADDLAVFEWPGKVPFKKDSYSGAAETLVDRVANTAFFEGEPIFNSQLAPEGSKPCLAALIPDGMRAMSVQIDKETEAGSLLVKGSRVDVVVTIGEGRSREKISRTILQNIEVMCVGIPAVGDEKEGEQQQQKQSYSKTSTVLLLVSPLDAQKLALAAKEGTIDLVVRGFADVASSDLRKGVTARDVLGIEIKPPEPKKDVVEEPKKPVGPTDKELYNMARTQEAQGKHEEAIGTFKRLVTTCPESDLAVDAQTQINAIKEQLSLAKQRQVFNAQFAQLRQDAKDGDFEKVGKAAERLADEFDDLQLDSGQTAREAALAVARDGIAGEKDAKRIYQMFRNCLLQKMLRQAEEHMGILQQRYPKSRYRLTADEAMKAAKSGQPLDLKMLPGKPSSLKARSPKQAAPDQGSAKTSTASPAATRRDSKPLIVLEVPE